MYTIRIIEYLHLLLEKCKQLNTLWLDLLLDRYLKVLTCFDFLSNLTSARRESRINIIRYCKKHQKMKVNG
jgi:hypothetical protein